MVSHPRIVSNGSALRYARAVENQAVAPVEDETALVAALRAGDEAAFRALIEMYHAMLVRVARMYVSTQALAEEVAQETWLAVLEGIDRFEGRSSLKTWLFRILTNRAEDAGHPRGALAALLVARARRARPSRPIASTAPTTTGPGHWAAPPRAFPEERLLAARDARGDRAGDRRPAADPARGDLAARHRGLERRRGV